jgi:hypothetical protein
MSARGLRALTWILAVAVFCGATTDIAEREALRVPR